VHHDASGTKSAGCTACHGTDLPTAHNGVFTGQANLGCFCHTDSNLRAEMGPLLAAGTAECVDCHPDPMDPAATYPYHVGAHNTLQSEIAANSAGCVSCHGSDLLAVLPADNPVTHKSEHNYCSCHAYHEAEGQTACEDCHVKPGDPTAAHPYHVTAHDAEAAAISGTKSSACTACHGTDVLNVNSNPTNMHIAGEHKNCSCHAAGVAGSLKECVDCHKDANAPHGFVDGLTHTGSGWVAASGHNTSAEGTVGAYTKWDGSAGVPLVKTSAGVTITAQWAFPTQNVFWASDDASASVNASTGLTASDVITCESCHTGLIDLEIAGPHGAGAATDWGIDPNFDGSFDYAFLWDGTDTHTITRGGAPASGIGLYVPGGTTEEQQQEIDNWDVGNASLGTTGPATVSNGDNVICAKCHDLSNAGKGDIGWANYPHEHHANRPISFGVYLVSDTTVTAETTPTNFVNGVDTVLAKPSMGREGAGACRNCHVAVPHGWVRPRLLVYTSDPAPYNIGPAILEPDHTAGVGQLDSINATGAPTVTANLSLGTGDYNNWSSSNCDGCGTEHKSQLGAPLVTSPKFAIGWN
jgi:hypothetical protein